jgi:EAL domain-containing protein (putative c-di-GMP-specific phosphodiesterase class I)
VGRRRADGSNVAAAEFAPALARSARAAEIDLWAFRRTLAWMQAHEDELEAYALVMIPLSSASVRNEDLAGLLMAEFMETPVPPGRICFGMPDHEVVENVTGASELIGTLREFGCRFMLDEFGSGHDNYDYIKSVDVDFVSVRSGFISDARGNPKDFAMAKSINELVHFMGKKTVAKQLPGADLGDTMREIGIDFLYDQSERVVMSGGPA